MKKQLFSLIVAIAFACMPSIAEITTSYYSSIDNTSGDALFNAISTIAGTGYKSLGYDGLYNAYKQTDNKDGYVWDMYSNCTWTHGDKECGNYKVECDCYNREHSIPQSWWGKGTSNQGCDIFHVLPTDGKVNGMRSNNPYGEVATATYTSENGSKVGPSSLSDYSGTVFEPIDEYKGDIARGILGTMVKWKGSWTQSEGANVFNGTYTAAGNYGLTAYSVKLFLKWHRQDPVSQKEIDRNNGIQATQGNRNPFIDYPYLVEYIWGEKAGETVNISDLIASFESDFVPGESDGWRANISTDPRITVSDKAVAFGAVAINGKATQTITVGGSNLTGNIALALSGTNASLFTLSTASVSGSGTVTITYQPTSEGEHTATLTLSSSGATDVVVTLTGNGAQVYTVKFDAGAGSCTTADLTEKSIGAGVTLPTATAPSTCTDYTFAGWSATQIAETTTQPTLYAAGSTYNPTSNHTLYAVYKIAETSSEAGGSSDIVFNVANIASANSWSNGTKYTSYTIDGITITYSGGDNDGKYYSSDNSWRSYNGGSIVISGGTISKVVSVPSQTFTQQSNGTWRYSGTGNVKFTKFTVTTGTGSTTTTTYTSTPECANCTSAEASFAVSTIEKLTTDAAFTNAFSSNNTSAVKYASSNTEVATIDESTGQVTIVGAGTTTITATQDNDDTHCYVKRQYTLTVTKPAIGDLRVKSTSNDGFCIEWNNIGNTTYTINITENNRSTETTFLENAFTDGQGNWTINDKVTASEISAIWQQNSTYGMKASGLANKTNYATESWLISPELDLSLATEATLTFEHTSFQAKANSSYLKLLVSEDQTNWAEQTINTWPSTKWTYVSNTLDLSGYVGKKIYIAFQYKSTTTSGLTNDTWEIKNLKVVGKQNASISGYPKNLTNTTSHCVTGLAENTTYNCQVTTAEGNNTDVIAITTKSASATTYTITTNSSTGGTCSANPTQAEAGATITLTATPNTGYKLSGWTVLDGNADNVTVTNNQFIMPASNVEVEAIFAKIEYTITAKLTNATAAANNPTTATIDDEELKLTFAANDGYELPASITVVMGSTTLVDDDSYTWDNAKGVLEIVAFDDVQGNISITIVATAKTYTVTFVDYDGTTLDKQTVEHGKSATAPQNPTRAGYTFTGWDKAFDNITSDLTVTAQYEENKPTAIATATTADPVCHTVNNMLYVSGLQAGSQLALYDATGRLLATRSNCAETETFALPNGIYMLKIGANGSQQVEKVVISK